MHELSLAMYPLMSDWKGWQTGGIAETEALHCAAQAPHSVAQAHRHSSLWMT